MTARSVYTDDYINCLENSSFYDDWWGWYSEVSGDGELTEHVEDRVPVQELTEKARYRHR